MESKDETEAKDKEVLANGISGMPGRKLIEAVSFFASGSASGRGGGEMRRRRERKSERCISQQRHFLDALLYNFFCAAAADTMQTSQLAPAATCSL